MIFINKALLVTAVAAACGMQSAGASTYASAILDISNFRILNNQGKVYKNSDFLKLIGINDAHATASLNADSKSLSAIGPRPDVAHQCVGAPCPAFGENNFTPSSSLPMSGNFGYADQYMTGSAISMNGATAGAHSQTRADVATSLNMQFANSNSSVGSSNTMSFRLGSSDTMTVMFDAKPFAVAYSSPQGRPVTTANARISWSVNIVDLSTGTSVFSYAPDEINGMSTVSRTHGNNGMSQYGAPGGVYHLMKKSPQLLANHDYQITVQQNTLVSALQQEIPEPGSLAIVGTGLLAMVGGRRSRARRRQPQHG
ncbi:MAG TPA: EDSAP-1 family PEP-CTERM protein [Pseudoduganella sp.]|jgi:hypothetical protein